MKKIVVLLFLAALAASPVFAGSPDTPDAGDGDGTYELYRVDTSWKMKGSQWRSGPRAAQTKGQESKAIQIYRAVLKALHIEKK